MKVRVLGSNAVGTMTASRLTSLGHQVIGVDVEVKVSVK